MKKESGFSLIELMITIIMSGMILAAASSAFVGLLAQSRTQGSITASQETLVGLDILRRDIESSGMGLFWSEPLPVAYTVESITPIAAGFGANFNEPTTSAPRAIIAQPNVFPAPDNVFDGSSYLVVKSVSVARNNASDKSTWVLPDGTTNRWVSGGVASQSDNLVDNDNVIVINLRGATPQQPTRLLVTSGFQYSTIYNAGPPDTIPDINFIPPATPAENSFIVYGVNSPNLDVVDAGPLARPFNRADYFISRSVLPSNPLPGNFTVPSRCEPNTGVLYKAIMRHGVGFTYQPLVDCVANMQIFFGLDTNGDGSFQNPNVGASPDNQFTQTLIGLTAQQIRTQVKEVRVYILAHEGRRDPGFIFNPAAANILVGGPEVGGGFAYLLGPATDERRHYRWKVYELTVKPYNLAN